jgi:hypothetical protein
MTVEDRGVLPMWVIYEHPSDYPEHFVVRCVHVTAGKLVFDTACTLCPTLEDARASLPEGLLNIGRQEGDDPVIREVWL